MAITADLRPQDRLSTMRARLPAGLIGEHALSHLRRRPELNPETPSWRRVWLQRQDAQQDAQRRERARIERIVRRIVEGGGHKDLNTAMKIAALPRTLPNARPPHLLLDARDIELFVVGLYPGDTPELAAVLALAERLNLR